MLDIDTPRSTHQKEIHQNDDYERPSTWLLGSSIGILHIIVDEYHVQAIVQEVTVLDINAAMSHFTKVMYQNNTCERSM